MSEVKKYLADPKFPGQYSARGDLVNLSDYIEAQSELAALREELASLRERHDTLKCQRNDAQQGLNAAEQRNSDLVELLEENQWRWRPYDDHDHTDAGYYCIQCYQRDKVGHSSDCKLSAAIKPTESVASEAERREDDEALQRRHDQERQEYFRDDQ